MIPTVLRYWCSWSIVLLVWCRYYRRSACSLSSRISTIKLKKQKEDKKTQRRKDTQENKTIQHSPHCGYSDTEIVVARAETIKSVCAVFSPILRICFGTSTDSTNTLFSSSSCSFVVSTATASLRRFFSCQSLSQPNSVRLGPWSRARPGPTLKKSLS